MRRTNQKCFFSLQDTKTVPTTVKDAAFSQWSQKDRIMFNQIIDTLTTLPIALCLFSYMLMPSRPLV